LREVSGQLNPVIALARFAAPPGRVKWRVQSVLIAAVNEDGHAEDNRVRAKADRPERAALGPLSGNRSVKRADRNFRVLVVCHAIYLLAWTAVVTVFA
jgi:hypothetical protein